MSIAYRTLIINPILLAQILLIVLKLNGNVHWSYAVILIPLWIVFAICFIWAILNYLNYRYRVVLERTSVNYIQNTLSLTNPVIRQYQNQQQQYNLIEWKWYEDITVQLWLVIYSLLLCFSILVTLRLDHNIRWNWFIIFIPIWVIALFWLYWWWNNKNGRIMNKEIYQYGDNENLIHTFKLLFTIKSYQFIMSLGVIVFSIFLPLQLNLDWDDKWDWWTIFLPLWISLGVWLSTVIYYTWDKNKNDNITQPLWVELIIYYTTIFMLALFTLFLTVGLNDNDEYEERVDAVFIFSPLIVMLGLIILICWYYVFIWKKDTTVLQYNNNEVDNTGGFVGSLHFNNSNSGNKNNLVRFVIGN